jgi:hypothetical protein
VKKFILKLIDKVCWWLDCVPRYEGGRWYRYGQWGCYPLGLAHFGDRLEDRWKTGVWDDWAPKFPVPLKEESK